MDRKETDRLLRKYYSGETNLEEEKILRDYFTSGEEIPSDLAAEKELFSMYADQYENDLSTEELEGMLDNLDEAGSPRTIPLFRRKTLYRITSIAASLAVILSVYLGYHVIQNQHQQVAFTDTYKGKPELAYNETKRVLLYVSQQFNKGTSELSAVSTINEPVNQLKSLKTMDAGLDKLEYLGGLGNKEAGK